METFYFIFGTLAVSAMEEGNTRETAKLIANGDGMLANMESGEHPGNLLEEFEGWDQWANVEEDVYREINELLELFKEKRKKNLDVVLLVSSGFGVYIPQTLMELYPEKFSEEQKEILSGDPYNTDGYWDTWEEIMNFVTITDEQGVEYYLHHDEDLWAVPLNYEFEDFIE